MVLSRNFRIPFFLVLLLNYSPLDFCLHFKVKTNNCTQSAKTFPWKKPSVPNVFHFHRIVRHILRAAESVIAPKSLSTHSYSFQALFGLELRRSAGSFPSSGRQSSLQRRQQIANNLFGHRVFRANANRVFRKLTLFYQL